MTVPVTKHNGSMLYLALSVACFLGVTTVFKAAERRGLDRTALLTANYASAGVLAAFLLTPSGAPAPGLLGLGIVQGILFIGGFWLFALAIRLAGMGLASGVFRLSVVIPVIVAWMVWAEVPSVLQAIGLVLAGVAFFLIARPSNSSANSEGGAMTPSNDQAKTYTVLLVLMLLFLSGGAVDVINKAFTEAFDDSLRSLFLLIVFAVAFLTGAISVALTGLRTGQWPSGVVFLWGLGLGLINYGTADFLLRAVRQLSAPVVFPVNNIAIVLGAALLGRIFFAERFTPANLAGLGVAALALVLLSGG